jgi:hypothetical protein
MGAVIFHTKVPASKSLWSNALVVTLHVTVCVPDAGVGSSTVGAVHPRVAPDSVREATLTRTLLPTTLNVSALGHVIVLPTCTKHRDSQG